jgi:uncharacterized protein (TIGR03435 family)
VRPLQSPVYNWQVFRKVTNDRARLKRLIAVSLLAAPIFAQKGFDVVSVKPGDPLSTGMHISITPGGGYDAAGVTLISIISQAYDVRLFQLVGASGWMQTDKYEIRAKNDKADPSEADLSTMTDAGRKALRDRFLEKLRFLLADRFQLKVHRETKEMPVYILAVAKGGSKLTTLPDTGKPEGNISTDSTADGQSQMVGDKLSVTSLAWFLAGTTGRTVIDQTGLNGKYDFTLTFAREKLGGDMTGPSIFTALKDQLGLTLSPGKGPVDVVVIDSAQKPSAN